MKIKVLLGTVRTDDREYKVGEEFNLSEGEALAMIREGVVKEVKDEEPKEKPKKEVKATPKEAKSDAKAKAKIKDEIEVEPSMDWTTKEISDYALGKGIENEELEGKTKREMLELIKVVKKGEVVEKGGEEK